MKRDMDLIKTILLNVENGVVSESIEGYDKETILEHKALLMNAGLLDGKIHEDTETSIPYVDSVHISGLTSKGYDFLDDLKNDNIFNKIKNFTKDMSSEAIKAYLLNFIKM